MPDISVIVPVYNTELYLHRCIDSILTQTFTDFELILVDDGSEDNSGAICKTYVLNDARVKLIRQDNNGPSSARNTGLKYAIGKYIAFLDSDDIIHRDYLRVLYTNMIATDADISICGAIQTDDWRSVMNHILSDKYAVYHKKDNEIIRRYLLETSYISWAIWGKLIRKEIVERHLFNENRIFAEDQAVTYLWFDDADVVVETDDPLYCWYINPSGATRKGFNTAQIGKLDTLLEITKYLSGKREVKDIYEFYLHRYIYNAAYQYEQLRKINELKLANMIFVTLKRMIKNNKSQYHLSPRSDPEGFNIVFPLEMRVYWWVNSKKSKLYKRFNIRK